MSVKEKAERGRLTAASEVMFVILPFIVIAIALGHKGTISTIFYIPEWSIVSSVVFGQSLMHLVGAGLGNTGILKEGVLLICTTVLVGGLIPALTVLAIVLTSEPVSTALAWSQGLLFLASVIVFWQSIDTDVQMKLENNDKES